MVHTIEIVIVWFVAAVLVGLLTALLALAWRRLTTRTWSNLVILEGSVAIGVVVALVGGIVAIAMPG